MVAGHPRGARERTRPSGAFVHQANGRSTSASFVPYHGRYTVVNFRTQAVAQPSKSIAFLHFHVCSWLWH